MGPTAGKKRTGTTGQTFEAVKCFAIEKKKGGGRRTKATDGKNMSSGGKERKNK